MIEYRPGATLAVFLTSLEGMEEYTMFRKDFFWGAAAASYQIEGAAFLDGKGKSVWDVVSNDGNLVYGGQTGNVACDHYHRYEEDVALMKEIGLKAYRFSFSWPRILPDGTGRINPKGLDFYDRLINKLLENNIEPFATLFHWDYPWELFLKGGWLNPDSPKWFEEYASVVSNHFKDRIKYWFTINEPQCFIVQGHMQGTQAPAIKLPTEAILTIIHNVNLAHGRAVIAIRNNVNDARVGYAPVGITFYPKNGTENEIRLAKECMFKSNDKTFWTNGWYMDPIFFGKYPEEGVKKYEKIMPRITDEDMKLISQPLDFFGCNIYHGTPVEENLGATELYKYPAGNPKTDMDWTVSPESLYWGPKFFYERYKKPIFITENGAAFKDWIMSDGRIHDYARIDFLSRYISQLRRAAGDDVDVAGYFLWSLLDNFEWELGYEKRFGITYVDYQTQKRTLKDSAYWYNKVIKTNGNDLSISF